MASFEDPKETAVGRILRSEQAIAIFSLRGPSKAGTGEADAGSSVRIAKRFGVSPKTVRDIWSKQTWVDATCACWTEEERKDYSSAQVLLHNEINPRPEAVAIRKIPVRGSGSFVLRAAKKRGRPLGSKDKAPRRKRANAVGGGSAWSGKTKNRKRKGSKARRKVESESEEDVSSSHYDKSEDEKSLPSSADSPRPVQAFASPYSQARTTPPPGDLRHESPHFQLAETAVESKVSIDDTLSSTSSPEIGLSRVPKSESVKSVGNSSYSSGKFVHSDFGDQIEYDENADMSVLAAEAIYKVQWPSDASDEDRQRRTTTTLW